MGGLFDLVRNVPAWQAAEHQGIHLKRSGSRYWACCPLHGEKTSSLCFYPEGSWYCFGCHKGGDAVRFYQEYLHLDALEAATRLADDFGIPVPQHTEARPPAKPTPTVYHLIRELERKRSMEWSRLCDGLHRARAILEKYSVPCDAAWESQEMLTALRALSYAEQRLDWLWQASYEELALEYREETHAQR